MDILGHMFLLLLDGRLYLAPIDEHPQRILDLGCGTGLWAIEMGDLFPSAQVIGNDLSPIQPKLVPPNVQFEVDDIESDWTYKSPFDFIHARYLATSIRDWPRLFRQIFENLKPGGYAEFLDFNFVLDSDDGTHKLSEAFSLNISEGVRAADIVGQIASPGPHLKNWAEDAGFIDIEEHIFKLPYGPWPKDPRMKELGAWNQLQALEGVEGWTMGLFNRVLGWSVEEVQVHLAEVRKNFRDPRIHSYITMYLVYGQKPKAKKEGEK